MSEEADASASNVSPPSLAYAGPVKDAHELEDGPLSRFDMAVIAIRMLGLFALLQATANVGWVAASVWAWLRAGRFTTVMPDLLMTLFPMAAYALGSFLLLTRALAIAAYVLPGVSQEAVGREKPAVQQLQGAAFAVAGILVCIWAIPEAAIALWWQLQINSGEAPDGTIAFTTERWVTFAVQMLLGIFLFMGSKRLAAFWHRLRHPELSHSQVDERQQ